MSAQHTPGPLYLDGADLLIGDGSGHYLAQVFTHDESGRLIEGCEKTAAMFTAAPELLEALRVLLEAIDGNHVTTGDYNQAHAAIAKAEGLS